MTETAISVRNLKKTYMIYKKNGQRLLREGFGIKAGDTLEVLKDVSFEIKRGEKVGLIGNIGSGRTTLMRILSGIITADSGTVKVNGTVTPVLFYAMGFEGHLTGRDNIRLKGTLMGWDHSTIREREEALAETAGIAEIIDEPAKIYPRGSMNRLGFVMNTEFKPDIMLHDEKFVVGGKVYEKACTKRLRKLVKDDDVTLLMTVNSITNAKGICKRGIVLDDGVICFDGEFMEATEYFKTNCLKAVPEKLSGVSAQNDTEVDGMADDNDDMGF